MRLRLLCGAALFMYWAGLAVCAHAQTAASPVTIERNVVPTLFTPGQVVIITVTIKKTDPRNVSAIAVQETVPGSWTYQNVTATDLSMFPLKSPDIANENGTKTLSFYYINIPSFPVTFTYRMLTGTADSGALSISGLAKFRFTGAEEQSPVVSTNVMALPSTEGEVQAEGEPGNTGCDGCAGCNQTAKDLGGALRDLAPAVLGLLALAALSRRHG